MKMTPTFKNKQYKIEDFFTLVKDKIEHSQNYDLAFSYSVYSQHEKLKVGDKIFIGDTSDFDDNENEIFPDFVTKNGFEYYCSDENIQDVIEQAMSINSNFDDSELLERLEYYLEKDTFMN